MISAKLGCKPRGMVISSHRLQFLAVLCFALIIGPWTSSVHFAKADISQCPIAGTMLSGFADIAPRLSWPSDFGKAIDLSADSRWLVAGHEIGATVYLYERINGLYEFSHQFQLNPLVEGERFGKGVAISGDGRVVAVTHGDPGFSAAIHVYNKNSNGTWPTTATKRFSFGTINELVFSPGSTVGTLGRIDMSTDGRVIVVGAVEVSASQTVVFWMRDSTGAGLWGQYGAWSAQSQNMLDGEEFGSAVCVSPDGAWIGVGARWRKPGNNVVKAGQLRLYQWNVNSNAYPATPTVIHDGDRTEGWLGSFCSVAAVNESSYIVVAGEPSLNLKGRLYVFTGPSLQTKQWFEAPAGAPGDAFARTGSISADGSTIAVSKGLIDANVASNVASAEVQFWALSPATNTWTQQLTLKYQGTFAANIPRSFGFTVKLSGNGAIAIIGDPSRPRVVNNIPGSVEAFSVWMPKYGEVTFGGATGNGTGGSTNGSGSDPCLSLDCGHGTCDSSAGGKCLCEKGWTGTSCSVYQCQDGEACVISVYLKSLAMANAYVCDSVHPSFDSTISAGLHNAEEARVVSYTECRTKISGVSACAFDSTSKIVSARFDSVSRQQGLSGFLQLAGGVGSMIGAFDSNRQTIDIMNPGVYEVCALGANENSACEDRLNNRVNGSVKVCATFQLEHSFPTSKTASLRVEHVSARLSHCDSDCGVQELMWRISGSTDQGHEIQSWCGAALCSPDATHDACIKNGLHATLLKREFPLADGSQRLPRAVLTLDGMEVDDPPDDALPDCAMSVVRASGRLKGKAEIDLNVAGSHRLCIEGSDTSSLPGSACSPLNVEYCFLFTVLHFEEVYQQTIEITQILSNIINCDGANNDQEPAMLFTKPAPLCVKLSTPWSHQSNPLVPADIRGSAYLPKPRVLFSQYLTYEEAVQPTRKIELTYQIGEDQGAGSTCSLRSAASVGPVFVPWNYVESVEERHFKHFPTVSSPCASAGGAGYWQWWFLIRNKLVGDEGGWRSDPPAGLYKGGMYVQLYDLKDEYPTLASAKCVFGSTEVDGSVTAKSVNPYAFDSHTMIRCPVPAGQAGVSTPLMLKFGTATINPFHSFLYTCSCSHADWDDSPFLLSTSFSSAGLRFSFRDRSQCESRHSVYVHDVATTLVTIPSGDRATSCEVARVDTAEEISWDYVERRWPGATVPSTVTNFFIRSEDPGTQYASLPAVVRLRMPWVGVIEGSVMSYGSSAPVRDVLVSAWLTDDVSGELVNIGSAVSTQSGEITLVAIYLNPTLNIMSRKVVITSSKWSGSVEHDIRCKEGDTPTSRNCTIQVDHVPAARTQNQASVTLVDYTVVPVRGTVYFQDTAAGTPNGTACPVRNAIVLAQHPTEGDLGNVSTTSDGTYVLTVPYGLENVRISVSYKNHTFTAIQGAVGSAVNDTHTLDGADVAVASNGTELPVFDFADTTRNTLQLVLAQGMCQTPGRFQFELRGDPFTGCLGYKYPTGELGERFAESLLLPAMNYEVALIGATEYLNYFARVFPGQAGSTAPSQTALLEDGPVGQQWIYRSMPVLEAVVGAPVVNCTYEASAVSLVVVSQDTPAPITLKVHEPYVHPVTLATVKCYTVPALLSIQDAVSHPDNTSAQCSQRFGSGSDCSDVPWVFGPGPEGFEWQLRNALPLLGVGSDPRNYAYESALQFRVAGLVAEYHGNLSGTPTVEFPSGNSIPTAVTAVSQQIRNILVTGLVDIGEGFSVELPRFVPFLFLYDPPGNGSTASLEIGTMLSWELDLTSTSVNGDRYTTETEVGAHFEIGFSFFGFGPIWKNELKGRHEYTSDSPKTSIRTGSTTIRHVVTERIVTAPAAPRDGVSNDLVVHLATSLSFSKSARISFNTSLCQVKSTLESTLDVSKIDADANTLVVMDIGTIRDIVIPEIAEQKATHPEAASRLQEQMDGWQALLREHSSRRANSTLLTNYVPGQELIGTLKPARQSTQLSKYNCRDLKLPFGGLTLQVPRTPVPLGDIKTMPESTVSDLADTVKPPDASWIPAYCFVNVSDVYPIFGQFAQSTRPPNASAMDAAARGIHMISFSGGGSSFSSTVQVQQAGQLVFEAIHELNWDRMIGVDYKTTVGSKKFFAIFNTQHMFDVDSGVRIGKSMSTKQRSQTVTVSFDLKDDSRGDYFDVALFADPVTNIPVFKTLSGRSRCPHEQGTAKREKMQFIGIHQALDVAAHDEAVIELTMQNTSPTNESMLYAVSLLPESDLAGLQLFADGSPLVERKVYQLSPYQQYKQLLTARRGPLAYSYNVMVRLASLCDSQVYDDAEVTVTFLRPCPPVEWRGSFGVAGDQLDRWTISQTQNTAGVSIDIANPDYRASPYETAPGIANVIFQYRKLADGETFVSLPGAIWVQRPLGESSLSTNFIPSQDGHYQVRVLVACAGSMHPARTATPMRNVIVDRKPPELIDSVTPAAGAQWLYEPIAAAFDESLMCGSISASLSLVSAAGVTTTVSTVFICENNVVTLHFGSSRDRSTFFGQRMQAHIQGLQDKAWNRFNATGQLSWTFTVAAGGNQLSLLHKLETQMATTITDNSKLLCGLTSAMVAANDTVQRLTNGSCSVNEPLKANGYNLNRGTRALVKCTNPLKCAALCGDGYADALEECDVSVQDTANAAACVACRVVEGWACQSTRNSDRTSCVRLSSGASLSVGFAEGEAPRVGFRSSGVGISLQFPEGLVPPGQVVNLTVLPREQVENSLDAVTVVVRLEPSVEANFAASEPVQFIFDLSSAGCNDRSTLRLFNPKSQQWQDVSETCTGNRVFRSFDSNACLLVTNVCHFTDFAVFLTAGDDSSRSSVVGVAAGVTVALVAVIIAGVAVYWYRRRVLNRRKVDEGALPQVAVGTGSSTELVAVKKTSSDPQLPIAVSSIHQANDDGKSNEAGTLPIRDMSHDHTSDGSTAGAMQPMYAPSVADPTGKLILLLPRSASLMQSPTYSTADTQQQVVLQGATSSSDNLLSGGVRQSSSTETLPDVGAQPMRAGAGAVEQSGATEPSAAPGVDDRGAVPASDAVPASSMVYAPDAAAIRVGPIDDIRLEMAEMD